jgi:hypothetical protein
VDVDPTEDAGAIQVSKEQQGYPWDMAPGNQEVIISYSANTTAKKYAVDKDGVITFAKGYGVEKAETWGGVFEALSQGEGFFKKRTATALGPAVPPPLHPRQP